MSDISKCIFCNKETHGTYGKTYPICFDCYNTTDPKILEEKEKEYDEDILKLMKKALNTKDIYNKLDKVE